MAIAPALAVCSFLGGLFDADEAPCCFIDARGRLAYANAAFHRRLPRWWPHGEPRWPPDLAERLHPEAAAGRITMHLEGAVWKVRLRPYALDGLWLGTVLRFERGVAACDGELERLKGQFLDTISHELRTPLAAVLGFQELLQEGCGGAMSAEQAEYVRQIGGGARHLLGLVNDLIDLAALQAGRLSLVRAPLDLAALARAAVRTARPAAVARGVELTLTGTRPGLARGDGGRVAQVLAHLLDNALKFTPPGGSVRVALETGTAGPGVAIDDEGPGIPDEALARVGERFFQADAGLRRERGGAGIGLALAKQLIEAQDGELAIARRPLCGLRVSFTLPAASA